MSPFLVGHAGHADWRQALARAAERIDAQRGTTDDPPTLGWAYFSDRFASHVPALLAALRARWPGVSWVGSVGVGVAAGGVEYIDEPALVLMLSALPRDRFEVFSGARRLQRIEPFSALVHADPNTPELAALVVELAERTTSGYLFGGLSSSRGAAWHLADGAWQGGLSGVAFDREVALISRVTQGCQPVGPMRTVTACERHVVLELDGEPALSALLGDIGLADLDRPAEVMARLRATLVGLTDAQDELHDAPGGRARWFGRDTRVRHLIGIDPARHAVAVAELLEPGLRMAFCQRDVEAARRDLVRICSEIRDEVETTSQSAHLTSPEAATLPSAGPQQRMRGAVYVSCAGRGGPHFGGPSAELQIVRRALGDVPLVGFFAGGEIARHHLYGYTGVLTVFTEAE